MAYLRVPGEVISSVGTPGMRILSNMEPDDIDQWKDNCDLIAAWSSGEGYTNYHKHKIHYTESGRGYIRKGSLRIYLDEIVMIA